MTLLFSDYWAARQTRKTESLKSIDKDEFVVRCFSSTALIGVPQSQFEYLEFLLAARGAEASRNDIVTLALKSDENGVQCFIEAAVLTRTTKARSSV